MGRSERLSPGSDGRRRQWELRTPETMEPNIAGAAFAALLASLFESAVLVGLVFLFLRFVSVFTGRR